MHSYCDEPHFLRTDKPAQRHVPVKFGLHVAHARKVPLTSREGELQSFTITTMHPHAAILTRWGLVAKAGGGTGTGRMSPHACAFQPEMVKKVRYGDCRI